MVYVRYDFYLINMIFIFIISHHSHMCPSPFFSKFSFYHGITVMGFSTWHDHHIRYQSLVMTCGLVSCWTWIWLRNGHSCQHVDTLITFSCWDIQGTKLSPAHPHISVSSLHKITQCHLVNYCRFAPVVMTAWQHSLKIIVNYEDDYLKHHTYM